MTRPSPLHSAVKAWAALPARARRDVLAHLESWARYALVNRMPGYAAALRAAVKMLRAASKRTNRQKGKSR